VAEQIAVLQVTLLASPIEVKIRLVRQKKMTSSESNPVAAVFGSAFDGWVTMDIPDPNPNPDKASITAVEGVAEDLDGNIYGAKVAPREVVKYCRHR